MMVVGKKRRMATPPDQNGKILTRPGRRTSLRQIVELQSHVFEVARNTKQPNDLAKLASAWATLEERKRIIRLRPMPPTLKPELRVTKRHRDSLRDGPREEGISLGREDVGAESGGTAHYSSRPSTRSPSLPLHPPSSDSGESSLPLSSPSDPSSSENSASSGDSLSAELGAAPPSTDAGVLRGGVVPIVGGERSIPSESPGVDDFGRKNSVQGFEKSGERTEGSSGPTSGSGRKGAEVVLDEEGFPTDLSDDIRAMLRKERSG